MSSPSNRLTVTSYAILGQLALRPWTTYELTAEMRRNFHYFWPRAESAVYAEVKRLAADGLVHAERSFTGRRGRTTYSISPAGRRVLEAWLDTPPKPYVLEFEGLLRVIFARFGSTAQLRAALTQTQGQADELLRMADAIADEYQHGRAPFQEQVDVRAFVFDFLASFAHMMHEWALRTEAEIADWDDLSLEERQARGQQWLAAAAQVMRAERSTTLDPANPLAPSSPTPEPDPGREADHDPG